MVLGSWAEGLDILRELGSTGNYFMGAGEQAHTFGHREHCQKAEKRQFMDWGDQNIIFRGHGSKDPRWERLKCGTFVHI